MSFMQPEIEFGTFYTVATEYGESVIPADVCGRLPIPDGHTECEQEDCTPDDWESICGQVADYIEGKTVIRVECQEGYGARLSAPGYMDCTEWTVHESEEEAEAYLEEMYGDDEEADDDSDN